MFLGGYSPRIQHQPHLPRTLCFLADMFNNILKGLVHVNEDARLALGAARAKLAKLAAKRYCVIFIMVSQLQEDSLNWLSGEMVRTKAFITLLTPSSLCRHPRQRGDISLTFGEIHQLLVSTIHLVELLTH